VDLRRLLAVHETAEEEIVHSRAKLEIADGAAVIGKRLEEDHKPKTALQKLEMLDVNSEEFTRHEEKDEFARLGEELSGDELVRMGRAAKPAEAIAPTRPHAGVESQLANMTAGLFAAVMGSSRRVVASAVANGMSTTVDIARPAAL
jgi:hypothetical protein